MRKKLFITDEKMLKLMDYAIDNHLVKNQREYFEKIGFVKNSLPKVREGTQGFTKEHIYKACRLTGASADWIYGFTNEFKRKPAISVIKRLREIVFELDKK